MYRPHTSRLLLIAGLTILSWATFGQIAAPPEEEEKLPLTHLSLDQLQEVEVTSVSRKEESLLDAPSAVYVLTDRDILRSGARSIPEALRMVPGLNLGRINANKWAISARGFNSRFANKLLVMIDGRTVYTPVFSGVYWDAQDTLLEDIDRIEVVRGPGATLWGANAVNGVINILTKDARDTQGVLMTAAFGTEEHGFGGLRYGGKLAESWFYRVYAKAFNRDDFPELGGTEGADEWWQQRQGFRIDWAPTDQNQLTIQGDFYYGRSGDRVVVASPTPPFNRSAFENAKATGYNLLARWSKELSADSSYTFQTYYDRSERENIVLDAEIDTLDADFQHRFALLPRHQLIWGAGYRLTMDEIAGSVNAAYDPASRDDQLFSAFIQDEIAIVEDRLFITPGTKLEHNDYSGWELQPSVRALFKPSTNQTIWASIARAVRTPARFEHDAIANIALPNTPSVIALINGNSRFDSEELIAYELGYRIQPVTPMFLDLALFYNDYDDLRTSERGRPILGAPVLLPITYGNGLEGETYGLEFAPSWQVTEHWRVAAGYSYLRAELHRSSSTTDLSSEAAEGDHPEHQFHLRSFLDLPHNFQLDSALYYVDTLDNQRVQAYTRLDVRLGWSPRQNLDLSLTFQNVLDPRHPEFGSTAPLVTATEIERGLYGKITWRF